MKYIIILLLSILFSQDHNIDGFSESKGVTTGSVGTVTINDQIYNQLSFRPDISYGKLGIVLDIYLYFNDDGVYWKNWDFSGFVPAYRTIIDKIYYLRWGHPGDDLYILAGALPSVSIGQGILVDNYSNIMEYPQVRKVGLNLQANISEVAIEFIYSNFKTSKPGLIGLRGSYYILPKLNLGLSFVTDMDQISGLPDSDGDNYPDYYDFYPNDYKKHDDSLYWHGEYVAITQDDYTEAEFNDWYINSSHYNHYDPSTSISDGISGFALDLTYTLTEKITLYSQYAQLIGNIDTSSLDPTIRLDRYKLGTGFVPLGLRAKLGTLKLISEFRISSRRFLFSYWDRSYDINRASVVNSKIITRESQLYQYGAMNGVYVHADMSVMNLINFGMGYQNMQGEKWDKGMQVYKSGESNQTFLATIGIIPSLIPKVLRAEAFYQKSNDANPFNFDPNSNTIWGYNIGIEVSSGVMLLYQARTTYISALDRPDIFLPVKSLQLETQFIF